MAIKQIQCRQKYNISYEIIGQGKEDILFLHGWGANKEIMKKVFQAHLPDLRQIYVDLPGFGESDLNHPLNTKKYANIINTFLQDINSKPKIMVGHSFGGKIAALLEPEILVLLSSAGILAKKRLWVRIKILIFKFFKMLGFGRLYRLFATKDVAGMSVWMYETLKNVVNEDFSDIFAKQKGLALVFWGQSDKTTPLQCGEKIAYLIKNSKFYPLIGDHFFFVLHGKMISEEIMKTLEFKGENLKNLDDDLDDEEVHYIDGTAMQE